MNWNRLTSLSFAPTSCKIKITVHHIYFLDNMNQPWSVSIHPKSMRLRDSALVRAVRIQGLIDIHEIVENRDTKPSRSQTVYTNLEQTLSTSCLSLWSDIWGTNLCEGLNEYKIDRISRLRLKERQKKNKKKEKRTPPKMKRGPLQEREGWVWIWLVDEVWFMHHSEVKASLLRKSRS